MVGSPLLDDVTQNHSAKRSDAQANTGNVNTFFNTDDVSD